MMPTLALPGEMTPGQLGPMSRDFEFLSLAHTLTMSSVGMPSVMQTNERNARVLRLENRIGGKRRRNENHGCVAPVFSTASATVLKTGQPSCVMPPLPE